MLAFTDTAVSYPDFLASIRAHREADRIVQGAYWENGKGCAIGCAIESVNQLAGRSIDHCDHAALAEAIGVPKALLRLENRIFERLPAADAADWPAAFAEAITPGADLEPVTGRFLASMLREVMLRLKDRAKEIPAIVERVEIGLKTNWRNKSPLPEWDAAGSAGMTGWAARAALNAARWAGKIDDEPNSRVRGAEYAVQSLDSARLVFDGTAPEFPSRMARILLDELRACR